MKKLQILDIILRYGTLLIIGLFGAGILYKIFLPLTIYPVYWSLLKHSPQIIGNTLFADGKVIQIIDACVATMAYYFLLILNLTTPGIRFLRRLVFIGLSFLSLLIVNILRIIILSFMYLANSPYFDITHKILWYFGSTIFVVLIWFIGVKYFKVESIPIYSDLKELYLMSTLSKKK